jgi:hypothetical protein
VITGGSGEGARSAHGGIVSQAGHFNRERECECERQRERE